MARGFCRSRGCLPGWSRSAQFFDTVDQFGEREHEHGDEDFALLLDVELFVGVVA